MIPLCDEQVLKVPDPDGPGPDGRTLVFHLRYITEKDQVLRFFDIVNGIKRDGAENSKPGGENGKSGGEKSGTDNTGGGAKIDHFENKNQLISLFLAGWSGTDIPFPANGIPKMRFGDSERLLALIESHISELTGITIGESKNSSRQQPSPPDGSSTTADTAECPQTAMPSEQGAGA